MLIFTIICLSLLLDQLLGEPRRGHPLVLFGNTAAALEKRLNGQQRDSRLKARSKGALAVLLLTVLPGWLLYSLLTSAQLPAAAVTAIEILGLCFCIGRRSLVEHARAVSEPLQAGRLELAREKVGRIVSRDTSAMTETEVTRATTESVLENASDACFASLFWFLVGGLPAALLHRFSNTLDAMWGYRTERYLHFGWAAARLDDLLNWIPARLGALCFALAGQTRNALLCWRSQARHYDSPNGGVIMAAGAGALGITLGGAASYHGRLKQRMILGRGRTAEPADIERSVLLFNQAVWLMLMLCLVISLWR